MKEGEYKLEWRRWLILTLFSVTTFMSTLICFTYAPIDKEARPLYGHHMSIMVTIFFGVNIMVMLPSTWIIQRLGLRFSVVLGAWLQFFGAAIRACPSLLYYLAPENKYLFAVSGQFVAALAQGFLVNPAPQIAATWFAPEERTFVTSIAVNINTLGIAGAYIFIPLMAPQSAYVPSMLVTLAALSLIFAVSCQLFFASHPETPPSASAHRRKDAHREEETWNDRIQSLLQPFTHKGFFQTLVAFGVAEAVINGFSSFMRYLLGPGFSLHFVSVMGSSFVLIGLIGSALLGWFVDRYRNYKLAVMICFLGAITFLTIFASVSDPRIRATWNPPQALTWISVLGVAFFICPLQPIALEVAVECTYPSHESAITALEQLIGNVFSTLLVPFLTLCRAEKSEHEKDEMWVAIYVILGSIIAAALYYCTFNGEYKRTLEDFSSVGYSSTFVNSNGTSSQQLTEKGENLSKSNYLSFSETERNGVVKTKKDHIV